MAKVYTDKTFKYNFIIDIQQRGSSGGSISSPSGGGGSGGSIAGGVLLGAAASGNYLQNTLNKVQQINSQIIEKTKVITNTITKSLSISPTQSQEISKLKNAFSEIASFAKAIKTNIADSVANISKLSKETKDIGKIISGKDNKNFLKIALQGTVDGVNSLLNNLNNKIKDTFKHIGIDENGNITKNSPFNILNKPIKPPTMSTTQSSLPPVTTQQPSGAQDNLNRLVTRPPRGGSVNTLSEVNQARLIRSIMIGMMGGVVREAASAMEAKDIQRGLNQTVSTEFVKALGSAITKVGSGAAVGTIIAPGIGTMIGAGAGALLEYGIQAYRGYAHDDEFFGREDVDDSYRRDLADRGRELAASLAISKTMNENEIHEIKRSVLAARNLNLARNKLELTIFEETRATELLFRNMIAINQQEMFTANTKYADAIHDWNRELTEKARHGKREDVDLEEHSKKAKQLAMEKREAELMSLRNLAEMTGMQISEEATKRTQIIDAYDKAIRAINESVSDMDFANKMFRHGINQDILSEQSRFYNTQKKLGDAYEYEYQHILNMYPIDEELKNWKLKNLEMQKATAISNTVFGQFAKGDSIMSIQSMWDSFRLIGKIDDPNEGLERIMTMTFEELQKISSGLKQVNVF